MITHTTHVVYTLVSKTVYSSSIFSYNQNFKSGKKGILQEKFNVWPGTFNLFFWKYTNLFHAQAIKNTSISLHLLNWRLFVPKNFHPPWLIVSNFLLFHRIFSSYFLLRSRSLHAFFPRMGLSLMSRPQALLRTYILFTGIINLHRDRCGYIYIYIYIHFLKID